MKYMMMAFVALSTSNLFAANIETIAFERVSYEASKSTPANDSIAIASDYFEVLDRIGSTPRNKDVCLASILSHSPSETNCLSSARVVEGGGTGGVD